MGFCLAARDQLPFSHLRLIAESSFRRRPESSLNMRPKDTSFLSWVFRTTYLHWIPAFAGMTIRGAQPPPQT